MIFGPGARIGPYEVTALLGEGGMGKVWRAHHTALKRDDALKVLPDAFASDPDRLARFRREAQVLASLNHPNIAHVYGLEQSDGVQALVMELVEGPTLADRIAQGPIPADEALLIAKQIAEALEAAHEQGIIHRDLKPANIKVRPDGTVKVLDFGLAKALEPMSAGVDATASPTITSPAMMTGVGMLLGTAAYMSPEQARGKPVDKRSDIWAFGCVLYEMLTGERPFDGQDVTDTLANVLKIDPDWSSLPSETPPAIRALLQSCLTKERRRRVADISTALFVLDKGASLVPLAAATLSAAPLPRRLLWGRVAALTGGALVVAAIATTLTWVATRSVELAPARVSRLPLAPSGAAALSIDGTDRDLAITPNGSRLIYVGNRRTQLFVRALDALEPVAVFTGVPRGPFVSPDGQWIGFVDNNIVLKKVAVTGGPPVTLATLDSTGAGATWGSDDTFIVATINGATGLLRVAVAGGSTTVLTRPDPAHGERDHLWPEMLPGGRAVLFTIVALTGGLDAAQVAVLDLQTGMRRVLVRGGSHAHYVPSGPGSPRGAERESGHLVYAAAGTLRAVPFDLASLETRGTPQLVIPQVLITPFGAVDAVVAGDGTLAYVSGSIELGAPRTLVWVDRQGRETPIPAPPRAYAYPRLSPDGTRIAASGQDQEQDLWLWDLARNTLTRLTFEPGADSTPLWTPDGRQLLFSSDRGGAQNVYVQAADGTGSATRLTVSPNQQIPTGTAADGTRVVFHESRTERDLRDLLLLTLTQTPRVEPLLETRFEERGGIVSPDGRWLAYESNSSGGRFEIYVRPFPNAGAAQWQVSSAGGVQALWARSGRELFYLAPDGTLMTVPVELSSTAWSAGTAMKILEGRYFRGAGGNVTRQYDVSPDGQRFLMIKEGGGADQTAAPPQIIIVQHWTEELKRLVPTN